MATDQTPSGAQEAITTATVSPAPPKLQSASGASPATASNALPQPTSDPQLSGISNRISALTVGVIVVSFAVMLCFIPYSFYVLYGVLSEPPPGGKLSTTEKMALAASVQVASGMMMGFISVFIGLLITWFGIHATFEISGKTGEKAEASLKSASPGLAFFLGGVILIGVSLYKPLKYSEEEGSGSGKLQLNPPPITKSEK